MRQLLVRAQRLFDLHIARTVAIVLVATVTAGAQGGQSVPLIPSHENFANPDRGFFRATAPLFVRGQRYPLEAHTLASWRREGISLMRISYVFDEFRDRPLSDAVLSFLSADLRAARDAGIKVIIRFSYNFPCAGELEPCNLDANPPPDATLERVLAHIDQLAPTLRTNGDVISYVEAGFIGAWGEWHHSTNHLIGADSRANADTAAVVERLLWALPENRMIALRYPYHKQQLHGSSPLEGETAFTQLARARIGHHNDCFLSNVHDSGTYAVPGIPFPPSAANLAAIRGYLADDTRFVPQGGESCSNAPAAQP